VSQELASRRQVAEGVVKVAIAFVVALTFVPGTYQLQLPLGPSVPAHSSSQQLYPANSGFGQAVQGNGGFVTPWIPLSGALDEAYSWVEAQQVHYDPPVDLQSASLNSGQNITFAVHVPSGLTQTQLSSLYIWVYVVNPEGTVAGTFPTGATVSVSSQPNYYFQPTTGEYSPTLTGVQGGVLFTWKTPAGSSSVGSWKVYVFITNAQGQSGGVTGGTVLDVETTAPPSLGPFPALAARVALFFGAYQAMGSVAGSYRRVGPQKKKWFADNALWFVAAAALLAFVYLAYIS